MSSVTLAPAEISEPANGQIKSPQVAECAIKTGGDLPATESVKRPHSPEDLTKMEGSGESVNEAAELNPDVIGANGDGVKKPRRDDRDGFHKVLEKENPRLEKYIKALGIVPEEEWETLREVLKEPLPTSFRVTGFRRDCEAVKTVINEHFLAQLQEEERKLCQEIPWYPDHLAFQINIHRRHMRKHDEFKPLRDYLISETAGGNISRQETVSMIPPVLLDVKPGHKVLDMCAAPGSKTAQIVDMLQGDISIPIPEEEAGAATSQAIDVPAVGPVLPDGLVVANDMELKRCNLLTHQIKRLQSPCVVVTNHDASQMPNICIGEADTAIQFDRVLCDVPCSGDGTIRKNLDLWRTWHPNNALALHPVQYRILRRGLEMLAVGGRLVYSTCSMNPVENEAILCRMLNETKATVELVDCSHRLPDLKRVPGLKKWSVMAGDGVLYEDAEKVPGNLKMRLRPEFFAPPNVEMLHLDRAMRVMPHFQNTGAFFIAVLHKKATLPWQKYAPLIPTRPPKAQQLNENEPLVPFAAEDPAAWASIKGFFKIQDDFPADQLFIRKTKDKSRHIYMVSKVVKEMLHSNLDRMRIVNAGVRILTRTGVMESTCAYRLAQEGLQIWMEHLHVAKITMKKDEIAAMLKKDFIQFAALSAETTKQVDEAPVGSIIVSYQKPEGDGLMFDLAAWKAASSVRCYVAKEERAHFTRLMNMDE
ncbi:tRNA (cytosine(34)-C(5))-methyltransferase [Hypsibius exemplaris]|uniref:tRNA (cytosine(34)-C(5))-methyltransferase n=1 Tax=Hypsibius exemplaris TaxID=2072580 RepID=A0A1W0WHD0_HYPEX|nr:tRNA (cytosine(34)-C(5))-methyltransferase [Hypsibius exemplaris]